jgi:hypothetical protein
MGLALKVRTSRLETVSTVRGSGWVAVQKCEIAIDYKYVSLHPSATADGTDCFQVRLWTFEAKPIQAGFLKRACSRYREAPRVKPVASPCYASRASGNFLLDPW